MKRFNDNSITDAHSVNESLLVFVYEIFIHLPYIVFCTRVFVIKRSNAEESSGKSLGQYQSKTKYSHGLTTSCRTLLLQGPTSPPTA